MKYVINACVLIFWMCSGVTAPKPTITREDEDVCVPEGTEFSIKCQGEGKLQFWRQIIDDSNKELYKSTPFNGTYEYKKENAAREDTGWYACAEEGVEINITPETIDHPDENVSKTYIYVPSSEPFVDMDATSAHVGAVSGKNAVIPCRLTSPELKPDLRNVYGEIQPLTENLTYHWKFGFIKKHMERSDPGGYDCSINGTDIDSWPDYQIKVYADEPLLPKSIQTKSRVSEVRGKNLTLRCDIDVSDSTYVARIWWTPPHSNPKLQFTESSYETDLTILNIEGSDAGEYVCSAKGVKNTVTSTTKVIVMDPSHPYLRYNVTDNKVIDSEHEDAKWFINVESFPTASLKWYRGKQEIKYVDSDEDPTAKYSRTIYEETRHFIKIRDLNLHDTGNYTIEITTSINSTVIPLEVVVNAKPIVRIHSNRTYYKPGELTVFTCNTTGFPKPNVTWSFSEGLSNKNYTNSVPLEMESESRESGDFSVIYDLEMPVNRMGDLICTSCNEMGCTETSEPLFVSDGNGLFGVDCNPPNPIEGDDITLRCAASHFNYTNETAWTFKNSVKLVLVPERMTLEHNITNFTSQSILRITNVSTTDAGLYSCEAKSKAKDMNTMNYTLTVIKSARPSVDKVILPKSKSHINLDKDRFATRTLNCKASGMPPPKVTWFKDGKAIEKFLDLKAAKLNNNSSLTIGPLSPENTGNYSCVAMNRLGTAEAWVDIEIQGKTDNTVVLWISLVCVLIIIIVIVITYMAVRVHRERVLRKELLEAGLTHFEEGALECLNPDLTVDEQAELLPYDKKWEFPRELLKLGRQLGSGAFGVVMKAEARGICVEGETTTVAVKMVRRSADPSYMKALSSELKIMIHLGRHLNVVNLLGACTKTILSKRELYVIVEYCRFGNLHNYLQRHRSSFINQIDPTTQKIDPIIGMERLARSNSVGSENRAQSSYSRTFSISSDNNSISEQVYYRQGQDSGDVNMSPDGGVLSNNSVQPGWRSNYRGDYKDHNLKPICTQDLLCWAWQVASGMKYLSDRKVLHGDLAARNILLAEDDIVKICDFGLAKNMYKDNNYQKKGEGPLPIKWMAIESIRDRIFSTQSDVWSFGIVLWEFFTLARTPYPGMEAETQYDKLIGGYRMEKPDYATDEIYDIMLRCWKAKPTLRPLFPELTEILGALLNDGVRLHYLDLNTPYMDMNTTSLQNGQNDYLTMMSSPDHDYYNGPDPAGLEVPPDTPYLQMSPVVKTEGSCIFSPRAGLAEVQFEFPLPEENTLCSSGVEGSSSKDTAALEAGSPEKNLSELQKDKVTLIDFHEEPTSSTGESGYSTDTNNPKPNNRSDQSSEVCLDGSYKHPKDLKFVENNKTDLLSLSTIENGNNYINMPKPKTIEIKNPMDAFSNPSYVHMSKPQETR